MYAVTTIKLCVLLCISDLEYDYLPWGGSDKSITLLKQPVGEPYVAIAELVDKVC